MKPSKLVGVFPMDSALPHNQHRLAAMRIIKLLAATGDNWRRVTYKEYVAYCRQENYTYPKIAFYKVVGFTVSPQTARLFSDIWDFAVTYAETKKLT